MLTIDILTLPATPILLGILGAYLAGGFAKGALGFGLPLVTISILPYFIPIDMALAMNAVVPLITNIFQLLQAGQSRETLRRCWPLLGGLVLGIPLGSALIQVVDKALLTALLGGFVMGFVLISALSPRFRVPPRQETLLGSLTGLVAGVVGALTSANGPVLVMYLVGLELPRQVFIGCLAWLFIATGSLNSIAYWSIGILDTQRVLLALLCLLPAYLGMQIGNALAARLSAQVFRRVVLLALFILGANLVRRALF